MGAIACRSRTIYGSDKERRQWISALPSNAVDNYLDACMKSCNTRHSSALNVSVWDSFLYIASTIILCSSVEELEYSNEESIFRSCEVSKEPVSRTSTVGREDGPTLFCKTVESGSTDSSKRLNETPS